MDSEKEKSEEEDLEQAARIAKLEAALRLSALKVEMLETMIDQTEQILSIDIKDRIAIYCRRLPAGTHTFTVDLEPGFTGAFTMNPATAEMMYFPTFSGRNGLKKVEVWE